MNQPAELVFRHPWAAGIIFAVTFVFVSFRQMRVLPIGRPSAALAGAVAMVMFGVMSPEEAYALVNWDTICLLLGMMIIAEHLRAAGLFERFTRAIGDLGSPMFFMTLVSGSSALLSALLVNDTVCVVMTPLVLSICETRRLNPFPYLMALATSANIGSALTLTGNPQNMIIGSLSRLGFGKFMVLMAAPVLVAWLVNLVLLWWYYRQGLTATTASTPSTALHPASDSAAAPCPVSVLGPVSPGSPSAAPSVGEDKTKPVTVWNPKKRPFHQERRLWVGGVAVLVACVGFFSGYSMAFSALAGAVIVITLHRKNPARLLARLEWSLLMFFAALFVVIGGLKTSGLADAGTNWAMTFISGSHARQVSLFSVVTLIGSNLFSNVPYVLMAAHSIEQLVPKEQFWCLLAYVSTLAGNLTLFGSVANLIVAESARGKCDMGFAEYARFGIPSTLLTIFLGTLVLYWLF